MWLVAGVDIWHELSTSGLFNGNIQHELVFLTDHSRSKMNDDALLKVKGIKRCALVVTIAP
jgi:hypothetical protein